MEDKSVNIKRMERVLIVAFSLLTICEFLFMLIAVENAFIDPYNPILSETQYYGSNQTYRAHYFLPIGSLFVFAYFNYVFLCCIMSIYFRILVNKTPCDNALKAIVSKKRFEYLWYIRCFSIPIIGGMILYCCLNHEEIAVVFKYILKR